MNNINNTPYTPITAHYINNTPLSDRKKKGQYMTPSSLAQVMERMFTYKANDKILDPAVGTGELLRAIKQSNPTAELHGWDIDENILKAASENVPDIIVKQATIFRNIAEQENLYDKIIGNPPYFEIKKNDPQLKEYDGVLKNSQGRLNIYALFFEYSLRLLKEEGELVFLVPPSMNNGAYFENLRAYILNNAYIKKIEVVRENNKFKDATTSVQIIHLIKSTNNYTHNKRKSKKYLVDFKEFLNNPNLPLIFTENSEKLKKYWLNKTNLHQLGYKVTTGNTIWNKHKNSFLLPTVKNTAPIIYSKDIQSDNTIQYTESLNKRRWLPDTLASLETQPAIVVNRIVGGLSNPQIRWAITPSSTSYYTENHVNVIKPTKNEKSTIDDLVDVLQSSPIESEYLQLLTGNTQISATELQYLIPFSKP